MAITIPRIPLGEYALEIISSPHYSLSSKRKSSIWKQVTTVTQEAFPERVVGEKEVHERTTDPSISTLYLIKKTGPQGDQIIGYLSMKAPTAKSVHICASVIGKEHRDLGLYPLTKNLAKTLEYLKRRFTGDRPEYVTAQSQFLGILNDLARDGILPVHLHPEPRKELESEAAKVADGLGPHEGFDNKNSIRRGAFKGLGNLEKKEGAQGETAGKASAEEGGRKNQGENGLEERLKQAVDKLDVDKGDAILTIGKYTPEDKQKMKAFEDFTHPDVQSSVLAELLLGGDSKSIKNAEANLQGRVPHIRILFKRGQLGMAQVSERIAEALAKEGNPVSNAWKAMHRQAKQKTRSPEEFKEMFEKEKGMQFTVFGRHTSDIRQDALVFTLDPIGLELLRIVKGSLRKRAKK